jgi:hypothetical protein
MMRVAQELRVARRVGVALIVASVLGACGSSGDATTGPNTPPQSGLTFKSAPCSVTGTLQLAVAQTARVDCSNGGSTVTLGGGGASYLIVTQLAAHDVADAFVPYRMDSGATIAARRSPFAGPGSSLSLTPMLRAGAARSVVPLGRNSRTRQLAFSGALRKRALANLESGRWSRGPVALSTGRAGAARDRTIAPPTIGSLRQFRVFSDTARSGAVPVTASLSYIGSNVLLYIDTLSAANGFTADQLQAFGTLFDQTLYPIDTSAFGPTSDIDQNGRIIMLLSPAVNRLTSASDCQTQGYVAGFFDEEDLSGGAADSNSNHGEIFYSVAPDPSGTASCAHPVDDVGFSVPSTFLHELQHLISYSQHVVVHGGLPEQGWLDEGLSIAAEELGSVYYEKKCPGTACRTNPAQLFPDSSQGFVADFLYDSYQYALLPDTASLTLHTDADDGISWRGGDWLLMRWLGDQFGNTIYKKLDQSTLTGVPNIEAAAGQAFPDLFANFGLALYTDSLPGLPRTTAPAADRFVSRNVRQLWNRLFVTSNGAADVPLAEPVQLFKVTADTTTAVLDPGTMSFFRLDTPANASTVSVQFSSPGGAQLPLATHPQLAIFRLPAGQ